MSKPPMVFLTPNEAKVVQLGLARLIEDMKDSSQNQRINWTPESRKDMKDILEAATKAASKVEKITGVAATLPPYEDGDDEIFLTKQS